MALSNEDLQALLVLNHTGAGVSLSMMEALADIPASELLIRILNEDLFGRAEAVKTGLKEFSPQRELETCARSGYRILTFWDENYPASLRDIPHPPAVLYVAGEIMNGDAAAIAIVGSRYPSLYGISQTRKFSAGLATAGLTVVSGLAQGIDLAAHEGALSVSYGRTIAVLGCGLEVDYPRHRKKFQQKITERGAVISEYSLNMPPLPENFPRRNRIISGLSLGVLVMEANQKSGSLITAQTALDQGREVFAMPGPVDGLTSKGSNQLIKQGAYLAENPEDILDVLKTSLERIVARPPVAQPQLEIPDLQKEREEPLSGSEQALMSYFDLKGPMNLEELIELVPADKVPVAALVTGLELKKKVRKRVDGRFEPVH